MLREKRRLAIKLRKLGKSYKEIKDKIKVPKSTLSYWLKDHPLSSEQIKKLTQRFRIRQIENYRETVRKRIALRFSKIYQEEQKRLLPLSNKELLVAGLFLYLGEGAKQTSSSIRISNTDPEIVKFVLYWYTRILKIPKENIRVALQLYGDMDIQKELSYWSNLLKIPPSNFWKPYIKKSFTKDIDHSGYKHGTCGLCFGNARLLEKILMGIKSILDYTDRKKMNFASVAQR